MPHAKYYTLAIGRAKRMECVRYPPLLLIEALLQAAERRVPKAP
jgi:hypothetical protein